MCALLEKLIKRKKTDDDYDGGDAFVLAGYVIREVRSS